MNSLQASAHSCQVPSLLGSPRVLSFPAAVLAAIAGEFLPNTREQPSTIQVSSVRSPAVCALPLITEHC